jgi:hypothetical protein
MADTEVAAGAGVAESPQAASVAGSNASDNVKSMPAPAFRGVGQNVGGMGILKVRLFLKH